MSNKVKWANVAGVPEPGSHPHLDKDTGYIWADCVECLECGKAFRSLGSHVQRIHNLTKAEYRLKHGAKAPFWSDRSKKLVSTSVRDFIDEHPQRREDMSKIAKSLWANKGYREEVTNEAKKTWAKKPWARARLLVCPVCKKEFTSPQTGSRQIHCSSACNFRSEARTKQKYAAKLTRDQVIAIRSEYNGDQDSLRSFASKYGVTKSTIYMIIKRKNWKDVP